MNNVIFNEEKPRYIPHNKPPSGLSKLVISTGIAKTEKGAQYVLLGVAIVAVVFALLLFFNGAGPATPPPLTEPPV